MSFNGSDDTLYVGDQATTRATFALDGTNTDPPGDISVTYKCGEADEVVLEYGVDDAVTHSGGGAFKAVFIVDEQPSANPGDQFFVTAQWQSEGIKIAMARTTAYVPNL